ncbi:MAG: hypothetical protein ACXW3Z_03155 [Limisphaerales bacterium]
MLSQYPVLADPGDVAAIGAEFQVNESPQFEQSISDVAMDENGDFVVVYDEFVPFGDPPRIGPGDVFARVYDRNGNPRGEPIRVTETTSSTFPDPAVAVDHKGNFVVVWSALKLAASGPPEIYARRFDRWGNPLSDEFQVNTFVPGFHGAPDVAMDHFGNFVISWNQGPFRGQQISQDGSGQGVFAQRFDTRCNAVGGEFQVNSVSAGNQFNSSVALNKSGNFVIAWSSPDAGGSTDAVVRLFDADGAASGLEMLVNTQTTGAQRASGIALNDSGLLAALWTGAGPEADGGGVYTRLFELESGLAKTNPIRVNPVGATPFQIHPLTAIAIERRGRFAVTWDQAGESVSGRIFGGSGAAFSDIFQANTSSAVPLSNGAIALGHDGGLILSWSSRGQDAPLSSGINARLLEADLKNGGN